MSNLVDINDGGRQQLSNEDSFRIIISSELQRLVKLKAEANSRYFEDKGHFLSGLLSMDLRSIFHIVTIKDNTKEIYIYDPKTGLYEGLGYETLSKASEKEISKYISKLGLIRRVKCFRPLSRKILVAYNGEIPKSREELLSLPCIGEYSSDAIRCFAYNENVAIIDSNVCRIVRRLVELKTKGELRRDPYLRKLMNKLLPQKDIKDFNWAMIDLGATICKPRKPLCNLCPIVSLCSYPKRSKNKDSETVSS